MREAMNNGHKQSELETGQPGAPDTIARRPLDKKGHFSYVAKSLLHVDHVYQRDKVSVKRLREIVASFSWAACGVLLVARRQDGTLWVYDGQHRKLGADKRPDVLDLPCMIFDMKDIPDEAKGYVSANTVRGPISGMDKFKAMQVANDPTATAVAQMVEASGYRIQKGSASDAIQCITTIVDGFERNESRMRKVWDVVTILAKRVHPINDRLISGLFYLDEFLERQRNSSITEISIMETMERHGIESLLDGVARATAYFKKGGSKVFAEGILNVINKGRSTRRIESVFASSPE